VDLCELQNETKSTPKQKKNWRLGSPPTETEQISVRIPVTAASELPASELVAQRIADREHVVEMI